MKAHTWIRDFPASKSMKYYFFFPFKLPALFVCYSITRRSKIHGQPILAVSVHSGATLCVAGRRLPVPWLAESVFYCQQSRFPVILGAYIFLMNVKCFSGKLQCEQILIILSNKQKQHKLLSQSKCLSIPVEDSITVSHRKIHNGLKTQTMNCLAQDRKPKFCFSALDTKIDQYII